MFRGYCERKLSSLRIDYQTPDFEVSHFELG